MLRIFVLFLCALLCITTRAQNKKALLDSASASIELKNYGRAINIYNKLLISDSTEAEIYILRADAYMDMEDRESAGRDYSYAIKYEPRNFFALVKRGDLLSEMGYFEYALKDYQAAFDATDADSLRTHLLVNRAETRRKMNDLPGAEKDLRQSLEYDSTNLGALANIGNVLAANGKPDEAIFYLERAIRLNPDFEGGYGNLAFLHTELGNYDKAIALNDQLLVKHPKEPYALNNRGYAKLKINDFDGALEDINNSIQLAPKNSYAFKNRGEVYLALKKYAEACSDFQKAIQLGFTMHYGNEAQRLSDKYCSNQKNSPAIQ